MAEVRIDVNELPARLAHALEWLAAGDDVLLTREGAPVARLAALGANPAREAWAAEAGRPPDFLRVFDTMDPAGPAKEFARLREELVIPNDFEEWAALEQEEALLQEMSGAFDLP
ncbi:MAG: hypothetical protein HY875_10660 [Chloroflexi bacterium]|nr:hypothetical protein [Chloroflexota bacterium]